MDAMNRDWVLLGLCFANSVAILVLCWALVVHNKRKHP